MKARLFFVMMLSLIMVGCETTHNRPISPFNMDWNDTQVDAHQKWEERRKVIRAQYRKDELTNRQLRWDQRSTRRG